MVDISPNIKPNPDCRLCGGTGKIEYEYCGVIHGGYRCECPPECSECKAIGGKPWEHAPGCSQWRAA